MAWHHPSVSSQHPPRGWGDSGEQFPAGVASVRHRTGALSEPPFAGPGPLPRPVLHSFLLVGEIGLQYKGKIRSNCLLKKGLRAVFHYLPFLNRLREGKKNQTKVCNHCRARPESSPLPSGDCIGPVCHPSIPAPPAVTHRDAFPVISKRDGGGKGKLFLVGATQHVGLVLHNEISLCHPHSCITLPISPSAPTQTTGR